MTNSLKLFIIIVLVVIVAYLIITNVSSTKSDSMPSTQNTVSLAVQYKVVSIDPVTKPSQTLNATVGQIFNLVDSADANSRYSFQVVDVSASQITLKQVADEKGTTNTDDFHSTDTWTIKKGETATVGRNVPGGGPQWSITL